MTKLKNYLESELNWVKIEIKQCDDLKYRSDVCWYALQRGLGASQLAQMYGDPFGKVEKIFEEFRYRLKEIEENE